MHPTQFRYTKDHEWLALEGDVATVGITDFAQHELGDIVFVELPAKGKKFKAGEVIGTVESVKAVSEIFAPLGGEVVEVSSALTGEPELLNKDPHGRGWLCRMKLDDPKAAAGLMDSAAYDAIVSK